MDLNFTKQNISLSRILAVSWMLFTENIKQIAIITIIVYVPINWILLIIENSSPNIDIQDHMRMINFLESFIGIIATLGIVELLSMKLKNKESSIQDSLILWLKSYGKVVWTSFITWIMIGFLTLLFIIPGVIYSIYWMFVIYIVIIHKLNSSESREYSKNIVQWRWWKAFWYTIVFLFLGSILAFLLNLINWITYWFIWWIYNFSISSFLYFDIVYTLIFNTLIDICFSYFSVVFFIFFLAFDATKENTLNEASISE